MGDVSSPRFWQDFYQEGRTGWDLGGPTPVFKRLLESEHLEPGRVIVLGAGRGYDAHLFAAHGFQVTAVDFAEAAVQTMQDQSDPQASLAVLQSDIFELPDALFGLFDYVLEYTCFCAIDPSRRPDYADVVARLLKPGGRLIALLFPIGAGSGGPPFPVVPEELIQLLEDESLTVQHRERPADSIAGRRGREELLILKKEDQITLEK